MNKVLIIDDDKELCALMKKCIEQEKLSAVTVYNGIEGVRLIDENKDSYSLIILDVMLPDIDGFQILQKIRDKSNIPVLMLTAKSSEEDKVFGLRLGADDYLTKPFGINELLARVNSLIRRYTTLNPFADRDWSHWYILSKICGSLSGAIPFPLSEIIILACCISSQICSAILSPALWIIIF